MASPQVGHWERSCAANSGSMTGIGEGKGGPAHPGCAWANRCRGGRTPAFPSVATTPAICRGVTSRPPCPIASCAASACAAFHSAATVGSSKSGAAVSPQAAKASCRRAAPSVAPASAKGAGQAAAKTASQVSPAGVTRQVRDAPFTATGAVNGAAGGRGSVSCSMALNTMVSRLAPGWTRLCVARLSSGALGSSRSESHNPATEAGS